LIGLGTLLSGIQSRTPDRGVLASYGIAALGGIVLGLGVELMRKKWPAHQAKPSQNPE
jgi:hypothetical protein